jgi:hypothetical protein
MLRVLFSNYPQLINSLSTTVPENLCDLKGLKVEESD